MRIAKYVLLNLIVCTLPAIASQNDVDGDGLDDRFEQRLLEDFMPTLMVSERECDSLPAEFLSGKEAPRLLEKNGTVYGQVFPVDIPGRSGVFIEAHYYHLWNRDCGLNGHELDVEHVSVLLSAEAPAHPSSEWEAGYWYAAAHEDTVCDSSHAVRSATIQAERRGPTVWISAGKHASYLDRTLCRGGCGGDDCSEMKPVKVSKLVNVGEPGAPMKGISWTQWSGWPFSEKMETDFPETVLLKLDAAALPVMIPVNDSHASVKTTILVGSSSAEAMIATNDKTGAAIASAGSAVGTSLDKSKKGTGNFLIRAARGVWRALGGGSADKSHGEEPR